MRAKARRWASVRPSLVSNRSPVAPSYCDRSGPRMSSRGPTHSSTTAPPTKASTLTLTRTPGRWACASSDHRTGVIGLPLRLLAREVYDKIVAVRGPSVVALVTGEERIVPDRAQYWVCTVEAMPEGMGADFVAMDEIQLCADPERGHVITDRLLRMRGHKETQFLGAATMRGAIADLAAGDNRLLILATRSGAERHATRFGGYFAAALNDPTADLDKNQLGSATEAFDFAERQVDDYYERNGQLAT